MADNTPFLVINPHAENKRLAKKTKKILSSAKDVFGDFQYEMTKKIGDGIPIAKKAVNDGYNTLVAIGGDGTLNEVINVAVNKNVKVGMVPGGSACDSHKTHGIPRDFTRAFEIITEGNFQKFPVGHTKGDQERYFIEMINGAFIGETSKALGERFEWAMGEIGYAYVAIRIAMGFEPIPSTITIDGKETIEADLSAFAVSLTDVISDFEMIPGNHPYKGDFAVFIADGVKRMKLIRLLLKAINGKHIDNPCIQLYRGKKIVIESKKPHTWEIEGEIPSVNSTRMEINYVPEAVNIIIPKGWKYGTNKKERTVAKKRVLKHQLPFN